LLGMGERVASLGGTMRHEGSRGTTLTITVPTSNLKAVAAS